MRELLIRYLLGELDEIEHAELTRRLAADAELRAELAHLRSCFAAACGADDSAADPPRGLAERTTECVANGADARPDSTADKTAADPPPETLGWSLADLAVAGGVVLAVSMLLFPALGDSRDATRRNVCQNNQRQLWVLVSNYAQDHGGYYPRVEPNENAGLFAVHLADKGYIRAEDLAVLLVCPGAPLAEAIRSGQFVMQVPSASQLSSMSAGELAEARKRMSPFYAYRFPYRAGGGYHHIRDERLPLSPVISDAPGDDAEGLMSPNHGGAIVQVICQDGSVKSLRSSTVPGMDDELFLNAVGLVAAGLGRQDTVLGRSEATPAMPPAGPGR